MCAKGNRGREGPEEINRERERETMLIRRFARASCRPIRVLKL